MAIKKYIATPTKTKAILSKYNFVFKKSLGQNFLIDVNILKNIIQSANIDEKTGVIEIGPGIGSLTEQLALHAQKVVAFEIDQRLIPILNDVLKDYQNIELIHQDILKADVSQVISQSFEADQEIHIIANLPYYITTPIIMKLLSDKLPITALTVMMQKEVAERIIARPNSKSYGSLSVVVQYYTKPEIVMNVPKSVFVPQPNVTSSVLKMNVRKEPPVFVKDEEDFFGVIRACFAHRRKTIKNNLTSYFKNEFDKVEIDKFFKKVNIDVSRRAESLTISEFASIANCLNELKS